MSFISKILDAFKMESKRGKNTADLIAETDNIEKNNEEEELLEIYSKIDKAKQLSKIMNVTIDKREFIDSLVELKKILNELIKYEERYEFDPAPSKDLEYLESVQNEQIKLLEKRIAEKEKQAIKVSAPEKNKVHLKMESIREMEKAADVVVLDDKTKVPYDDKFDEEYRKGDTYREISFSGKEWNSPEVQLCATLLLYQSRKGSEIGKNATYSRYYEGKYGITNISKLHKWLYENGYLRDATLLETLGLYKVSELKTILESLGLKKTGNKDDLIKRVIESIDEKQKSKITKTCNYLFLTEKGKMFLDVNYDFVLYHRSQYDISLEEFCKNRFIDGRKRTFNDTIYQILTARAYSYQLLKYFSRLEMVYWNLSNICDSEGNGELALRYALYRLYFSTNLASHPELFETEMVKFNGINGQREHIKALNEAFNKVTLDRIIKLKEYYGEHILDIIYGMQILPYTIFDKIDLADAIYDLLNKTYFDAEHYIDYICARYEKYIKKFL